MNSHAPLCFSGVDLKMPMLGPKISTTCLPLGPAGMGAILHWNGPSFRPFTASWKKGNPAVEPNANAHLPLPKSAWSPREVTEGTLPQPVVAWFLSHLSESTPAGSSKAAFFSSGLAYVPPRLNTQEANEDVSMLD